MRHTLGDPDDIRQMLAEQDTLTGRDELRALMPNYREPERTLSEAQAAQWLGVKPVSLARRRRRGTGPAVHEIAHGSAMYTLAALGAWLEVSVVQR